MQTALSRAVARSPLRGRMLTAVMLAQEATDPEPADSRLARAQETSEELTRMARESRRFRLDWETWNPQRATLVRATRMSEFQGLLRMSEQILLTLASFEREHGSLIEAGVLTEVHGFLAWLGQRSEEAEGYWSGMMADMQEDAGELATEARDWEVCDHDPETRMEPFERSA